MLVSRPFRPALNRGRNAVLLLTAWRCLGYSFAMLIRFTKMHGVGNDFIVFDAPQPMLTAEQLRRLADRHTGIGYDQALLLEPPRRPDTAVFYRIFNSDGFEVEQCGNGARCIAALLHRQGRARVGAVTMDSPAGLIHARILRSNGVSVDMGVPSFAPHTLPFDAPVEDDPFPRCRRQRHLYRCGVHRQSACRAQG